MFPVLHRNTPRDLVEVSRPTKVKLSKFSQRHPLCNLPAAFCSHLSRISTLTQSFKYPHSAEGRKLRCIHAFTAAENIC